MVNIKNVFALMSFFFLSGCGSHPFVVKTDTDNVVDKYILESASVISKSQFELHQTGQYAFLPVSSLKNN